jgi:CspA family cold shock protein
VSTYSKHTGTVKWFGGNGKAFGFIEPDDGSQDIFVHISAVGKAGMRELNEGDRLEYIVETDPKSGRKCAGNLRAI